MHRRPTIASNWTREHSVQLIPRPRSVVKLKFHRTSSQYVANMLRGNRTCWTRMLRRCYEETAPVEFKLYRNADRNPSLRNSINSSLVCGLHIPQISRKSTLKFSDYSVPWHINKQPSKHHLHRPSCSDGNNNHQGEHQCCL